MLVGMPFALAPRRARLRPAAAGLVSLSLAVTLAACSSDPKSADPADPQDTADGATFTVTSALTGQELPSGNPDHPVIAVKIDNSSSSRPQVGLGSADMVVEELVEGGMTRLAVFFHSKVPKVAGPVRSMRATDIGIVQPLKAVLVASGGAPQTVNRVKGAGITAYTEGATGYFRDSSRSAPYNLMMELRKLAGTTESAGTPDPYLPFGDEALPRGKRAGAVTASFSGASSTSFEFRKGKYVNTDTNADAADQFEPATVLVLRVQVGDAGYLDPAGNPVPETKFTGEGEAMIFHRGRVVRGRWTKNGLDAPVRLVAGGSEVSLPPGKVWIELVPANGGGVTVQR